MGLAADRDYFAIEKGAESGGYNEYPDEARKVFTRAETKKVWGKSPSRLDSTIDVEDVLVKWRANLSSSDSKINKTNKSAGIDLRTSDDVGYYVCGFVYYTTLEWFWKTNGAQGLRRVLFLHVPKLEGTKDFEKGKDVAIALIKAVIDSCGM
jgi:pyrrolidone-carboxylate peptidase